jgi:hypothetical protein
MSAPTKVVRPKFGTPIPQPACDGACCATVPPPRESGIAARAQTVRVLGPRLSPPFGTPANDTRVAIERVRTQRTEVVRLTVAVLDAISAWQRARDAETRAALRCMWTRALERATRDAEARLLEAEDLCAAAEAALTILENVT